MALIIEDGSIVEDADSYILLAHARANAASRGLSISTDDDEAESQLRQGYNWLIDTYEYRLQGSRVSAAQTGAVPRMGMVVRGFEVEDTTIPREWINAQVNMASSINAGVSTNSTSAVGSAGSAGSLTELTIPNVITKKYSASTEAVASSVLANTPAITRMLSPFFTNGGRITKYREDMRFCV